MKWNVSSIWKRVTDFIFIENDSYTKHASTDCIDVLTTNNFWLEPIYLFPIFCLFSKISNTLMKTKASCFQSMCSIT